MKKVSIAAVVLSLASCVFAQDAATAPKNITKLINHGPAAAPSASIYYGGGPIMANGANVYIVYYGSWTKAASGIINTYLQHLGGSGEFNVNTTYSDTTGAHVANVVNYVPKTNSYHDNYSFGKNITDADTQLIIGNAIAGGHLPNDPNNGVYFVLTYKDVIQSASNVGGSFCTVYCGYHSPSTTIVAGETIKYSFVGDPARCPSGCDGNIGVYGDKTTPNGNVDGDGIISVMFHELSETVSDQFVTLSNGAWGDLVTGESGDMCNFTYGTTQKASNGAHYNETINGVNYLVQQMFQVPTTISGVGYYTGSCITTL